MSLLHWLISLCEIVVDSRRFIRFLRGFLFNYASYLAITSSEKPGRGTSLATDENSHAGNRTGLLVTVGIKELPDFN